jgi:hypothetical protein
MFTHRAFEHLREPEGVRQGAHGLLTGAAVTTNRDEIACSPIAWVRMGILLNGG